MCVCVKTNSILIAVRRKRRLHKMLVSMVVIFFLCWLSVNTLNVLRDLQVVQLFEQYISFTKLFIIAHTIAMSGTCWNPILYAWMNHNFRQAFLAAVPCCKSSVVLDTDTTTACTRQQQNGVHTHTHDINDNGHNDEHDLDDYQKYLKMMKINGVDTSNGEQKSLLLTESTTEMYIQQNTDGVRVTYRGDKNSV